MIEEPTKFKELPTPLIIELGIVVQPHWRPLPDRDSWLVPAEEYEKVLGRIN